MKTANLDNVRFGFKGAYIEQSNEIRLFLQRQGVTKTLNCAHPLFFVEVSTHGVNSLYSAKVHYSGNHDAKRDGQIYKSSHKLRSEQAALKFIKKHAGELAKKAVTTDKQILSHCHGWVSYDYQENDKFLSPVYYCEHSDTIRLSVSNICLAAFTDGLFDKIKWDIDAAATKYIPLIKKILPNGFHGCDRKRGDDYCKRRLAWLLGARISSEMPDVKPKWCNQNMTLAQKCY